MKHYQLKSLIQRLIKEAIVNKIGEGQPVGGIKNDHDFDAGRHNVMKAVNVAENDDSRPCDCGSGQDSEWAFDGQGIPLVRVCPRCKTKKLSKFRSDILRPYSQADVDEPIEPDYQEEAVGFDGKYVDDMESGTAVKKLHGLDEIQAKPIQLVYPEDFKTVKNYIRVVKNRDTGEFVVYWFENDRKNDDKSYFTDDAKDAWDTFVVMKRQVDKANEGTFKKGTIPHFKTFMKGLKENDESPEDVERGKQYLKGKFVERGQIKLEGGLDYDTAYKIASYHWDIFGQSGKDERGVWNFQTRGNRWCCSVGKLNGQPVMLSITTTPGRLQLLVGDEIGLNLKEQTGTGAVAGYSTPFAFSKNKQGSSRAIASAKKYGTVVKSISEKKK